MFAKLAAIEGRPISPMDAKIIADFESQHGDMLDFFQRENPEALNQYRAEYRARLSKHGKEIF